MNEQKEDPETAQDEKDREKEQAKSSNQNFFDALMNKGGLNKLLSGLPSFLAGVASGWGITQYFSHKNNKKIKSENEELKQSLHDVLKKLKKQEKKQRKQHNGQESVQGTFSFLNDKRTQEKDQHNIGAIKSAYLD